MSLLLTHFNLLLLPTPLLLLFLQASLLIFIFPFVSCLGPFLMFLQMVKEVVMYSFQGMTSI
jgi:hypothetical protein